MTREDIIKPENLVYKKPELLNDTDMHYCPGCSHGVVHKLVAEVIAEMGLEEKTIGISPVGCAVFAYRYIDIDWKLHTDARQHLPQHVSDFGQTVWCLHIKEMAI